MIESPIQTTPPLSDRTRTLGAKYYTREDILALEKEHLFFKHWQFVCHSAELAEPGAYKTVTIFDQNIILTRTKSGDIKAYFNVCPHRGHQLVEEGSSGTKRSFMCAYHAWTFALDGKLLGARGVHDETGVDKSQICLFNVRVDQLVDFVFVNLDPNAVPLNEYYPGLAEQLSEVAPDIREYKPIVRANSDEVTRPSHWNANWKVLLDNFLECYHCETAHPTYSKKLCVPATLRDVHEHYTHEVTPLSPEPSDWTHPVHLENDTLESHFWFLFPSTVIGRSAGVHNFYISRIDPISAEKTTRTTTAIMPEWPDADAPNRAKLRYERGAITGEEDQALCESVQKGMNQIGFREGWYINDPDAHNISEHALQYFHDLYLEAIDPHL